MTQSWRTWPKPSLLLSSVARHQLLWKSMLVNSAGGKSGLQKKKPGVEVFPAKQVTLPVCLIFGTLLGIPSSNRYWLVPSASWFTGLHYKGADCPEILHRMFNTFITPSAELPIIRTMTICLLGYTVFFRFSKLASVREWDVVFYDQHVESLSNLGRLINSGTDPGYLSHAFTQI